MNSTLFFRLYMKKLSLIFSLFFMSSMISAGQQSPCTQLQEYLTKAFIATDIAIARMIMSDDEVICKAAQLDDPCMIRYCLNNNIGQALSINKEGHTPLFIAKINNNTRIIEALEEQTSSPRTVDEINLTPPSSPVTSRKKND
jgi:hypothetical protein